MRLAFVGPPGVGKGTQAKRLADFHGIVHISTGDILRDAIKQETPVGKEAKGFIDKGAFVPDEVMIGIIRERFEKRDCAAGFILDGFPRTIPQAEALDQFLSEIDHPLQRVFVFDCPDEFIVERITGRRTCSNSKCQETFHVRFLPPKVEGACDKCGEALEQRSDDSPGPVTERLEKYHATTKQIIPFYEKQNLTHRINGALNTDQVFEQLKTSGVKL